MVIEKGSCCVPEGYYYHSGNEPLLSRRGVAVYQRGTIITVMGNHCYRDVELLCTRGVLVIEKGSCCVPEGYYYHSDGEPLLFDL